MTMEEIVDQICFMLGFPANKNVEGLQPEKAVEINHLFLLLTINIYKYNMSLLLEMLSLFDCNIVKLCRL